VITAVVVLSLKYEFFFTAKALSLAAVVIVACVTFVNAISFSKVIVESSGERYDFG